MSVVSNEQFAKQAMLLSRPARPFVPTATYDPDGDCLEFLAEPDPFYAERVDDLVTVYYSQETDQVIGSLIKGYSKFCKNIVAKSPGFVLAIESGRVRIDHIFLAHLWLSNPDPHDIRTLTYRKLIDVAEKAHVEAEMDAIPA